MGLFAYRLVSGHWWVQTGPAQIGEEGTVTTARVFGLNVVTGWDKRRPQWVDVAWLAMRVHVGRQRKMGGADVIDVEGEDEPPPPPPRPGSGKAAPPQGDTEPPPPPPKAPRTAPLERAEPGARRGQRGAVHKWVEQQQQLQRAGAWEAPGISAEAANRDLEARLSRANDDRRAAKSQLADVTKERDRLVARVKTLERDLGTARKAKPPAQAGEGPWGAEAPPGDRAGGGGGQCRRCPVPSARRTGLASPGRGMRRPDVGGVHRPADGHDGQWPEGRCGQCGPQRPQGECRTRGCAFPPPPPHAGGHGPPLV